MGLKTELGPGCFGAMHGDAGDEAVLCTGFGEFSFKIKGIGLC